MLSWDAHGKPGIRPMGAAAFLLTHLTGCHVRQTCCPLPCRKVWYALGCILPQLPLLLLSVCAGAVSVALVYYYFDDNPRQMLDKGRATLIVTTLMVSPEAASATSGNPLGIALKHRVLAALTA